MTQLQRTINEEELDRWRQRNLGRLLIRAFDTFEADVLEGLRSRGIEQTKKTYLPVLRNLDLRGNRITELAARSGLSKQAVGPIVHELREKGILSIAPDPTDGRAKLVGWTEEGLQGLLIGLEVIREVIERYKITIGEERMDQLCSTLELLLEHFEQAK